MVGVAQKRKTAPESSVCTSIDHGKNSKKQDQDQEQNKEPQPQPQPQPQMASPKQEKRKKNVEKENQQPELNKLSPPLPQSPPLQSQKVPQEDITAETATTPIGFIIIKIHSY